MRISAVSARCRAPSPDASAAHIGDIDQNEADPCSSGHEPSGEIRQQPSQPRICNSYADHHPAMPETRHASQLAAAIHGSFARSAQRPVVSTCVGPISRRICCSAFTAPMISSLPNTRRAGSPRRYWRPGGAGAEGGSLFRSSPSIPGPTRRSVQDDMPITGESDVSLRSPYATESRPREPC